MSEALADWLEATFGAALGDLARYERALTHGSQATANYERLEFLGDRVLGLAIAEWLFEHFPDEPEGALSKRLNALVTGAVCAEVARAIEVLRVHGRLAVAVPRRGAQVQASRCGPQRRRVHAVANQGV